MYEFLRTYFVICHMYEFDYIKRIQIQIQPLSSQTFNSRYVNLWCVTYQELDFLILEIDYPISWIQFLISEIEFVICDISRNSRCATIRTYPELSIK